MSFQAYLDSIQTQTGKAPQDIASHVRQQRLAKPGEIVAWLKREYGLGHGHAMAIVALLKREGQPSRTDDDKISAYFTGAKAKWRPTFDRLVGAAKAFGPDVSVAPAASYVSLVKGGRKFAIVQATGERLDVGLKLKGLVAEGRLTEAGQWNAMVTHRVSLGSDAELDQALLGWLQQAYAGA